MIAPVVYLIGVWADVRDFTETGGPVLLVIAAVMFLMWALVLERLLYHRLVYPNREREILRNWNARQDQTSWMAQQIRLKVVSQVGIDLERSLGLIKTLVAICPLLGLLGTVTGMVSVFDVMAVVGTGNARAMASGISQATIPTMAGMVGALAGVFASTYLERQAKQRTELLADHLTAN